jgi:hypothetical protein
MALLIHQPAFSSLIITLNRHYFSLKQRFCCFLIPKRKAPLLKGAIVISLRHISMPSLFYFKPSIAALI